MGIVPRVVRLNDSLLINEYYVSSRCFVKVNSYCDFYPYTALCNQPWHLNTHSLLNSWATKSKRGRNQFSQFANL